MTAQLGPFHLDALTGLWLCLWTLRLLGTHRHISTLETLFGYWSLLCQGTSSGLFCLVLCLMASRPDLRSLKTGWATGLLAPALCLAALTRFGIIPPSLTPLAGLMALPAFFEAPVLAYALIVPPFISTPSTLWPPLLISLGAGLCLILPVQRLMAGLPLFLLGLALSARAGGLPDSALAGAEGFVLAIMLGAQDAGGWLAAFRTPLPPLTGFLVFWLAFHTIDSLCSLSPVWTASGMMLSLLTGGLMVRCWYATWLDLSAIHKKEAQSHHGVRKCGILPGVTIGLVLSICPGLLFGLVHPALLAIAGNGPAFWRSWPLWSVGGGDGAFWYPALIMIVPALLTPAIMTGLPAHLPPLPAWPLTPFRPGLSFPLRRVLVRLRQLANRVRFPGLATGNMTAPAALEIQIRRHALPLWLTVLGCALVWLGWTAR